MVVAYCIPDGFIMSELHAFTINGQDAAVGHTHAAEFACLATDKPVDVEVTVASPLGTALVRPLSRAATLSVQARRIAFRLAGQGSVSVEPEKHPRSFPLPVRWKTTRCPGPTRRCWEGRRTRPDSRRAHPRCARDEQPYNAGYTASLIGGIDDEHDVCDVRIEGLYVDGRRVTAPDDIELYARHANGIEFR